MFASRKIGICTRWNNRTIVRQYKYSMVRKCEGVYEKEVSSVKIYALQLPRGREKIFHAEIVEVNSSNFLYRSAFLISIPAI